MSSELHLGRRIDHVLDPDGHEVEAVHHGPAERSARSVRVTPRE